VAAARPSSLSTPGRRRSPPLERHPLDSSSLASVGYDPERHRLQIEFRTGHVYEYQDVPSSVYRELLDAPSAGRFFTSSVRNRFPFRKLS
jgi:KTSC domain